MKVNASNKDFIERLKAIVEELEENEKFVEEDEEVVKVDAVTEWMYEMVDHLNANVKTIEDLQFEIKEEKLYLFLWLSEDYEANKVDYDRKYKILIEFEEEYIIG